MPYKDPEARRANARIRSRRRYAKHKAKILALQKTSEGRAKHAALVRELRSRRSGTIKEINRKQWLRRKKNEELLAGRPRSATCEVCSTTDDKIVFDHCHQRGHFRGWLCQRCNRVLGSVKDDARLLMQLAAYLQRTKVNTSPQLALPV